MLAWTPEKKEEETPQPGTEPWDDTRRPDLDYGDDDDDDDDDGDEDGDS